MATLLRVDASARRRRSLSRDLADRFIAEWRARHPADEILHRDVGADPPPAVTDAWIAAAFTAAADRGVAQRRLLALSDALIAEVRRADVIVIATPMYNYGMPAALKAWIDQVVRVDQTFTFDLRRGDFPLRPTLTGKTLVLLSAAGEFGFAPGGARSDMNHLAPHLKTVSRYLGAVAYRQIAIEYQAFGDDRHARSVAEAHASVAPLVAALAGFSRSPSARQGGARAAAS